VLVVTISIARVRQLGQRRLTLSWCNVDPAVGGDLAYALVKISSLEVVCHRNDGG
jgi:hypothetical protein